MTPYGLHVCREGGDQADRGPFFDIRHFGEAPRWYIGDQFNAESYIPIVFCPYCGIRLPEA